MTTYKYSVRDQGTFLKLTDCNNENGERHISALYFFFMMDSLADVSHSVLKELFNNPQVGRDFGGASNLDEFAKFLYEYGRNAKFLGKEQRHELFAKLFGDSEDSSQDVGYEFTSLRDELMEASSQFLESDSAGSHFTPHERLRIAHRTFREYLQEFHGDVLKWLCVFSLNEMMHDYVYKVFRSQAIAASYGVRKAPGDDWPYCEDFDGAKMVERLSSCAQCDAALKTTRERFDNLQRAALRGSEAITAIIDVKEFYGNIITGFAEKCCAWQLALRSLSIQENFNERRRGGLQVTRLPAPAVRYAVHSSQQ